MAAASVTPTIIEKYKEHAHLTAELAKLEYVPPALQSAQRQSSKLRKELKKRKEKVSSLQEKTKSELKDYEELKRSTSKRFFIRLTSGKKGVDKKVEKEEKEWIEADAHEKEELQAIDTLEHELEQSLKSEAELEEKQKSYDKIRKQLDELYETLFGGVNTDWPEEDAAEEKVKAAQGEYTKSQEALNKESQANSLLVKAEHALKKVVKRLEKAEETSLTELINTNRLYEIYEHPDLRSAKKHLTEAETLIAEAKELRPSIKEIGKVLIPLQGEGLELIHAEVQLHKLINSATKEACKAQARIEMEVERSKEELKDVSKKAIKKVEELEKKKAELEVIRRSIFEKVHNGGASLGAQAPWVPTVPDHAASQDTAGLAPGFPSVSSSSSGSAPITFPSPQGSIDSASFPIAQSMRKQFQAGGFRSRTQIGGEEPVIAVSGSPPGSPTSPIAFPNAPSGGFELPSATGPAPAQPGFRVAAEGVAKERGETTPTLAEPKKGIPSAIIDATFPTAIPWGLNPYAASVLWNATHDSRDKSDSISMPQAPGDSDEIKTMPGGPSPLTPDTPSAPAPAMPAAPSSSAPPMPVGPPSSAPGMPSGPPAASAPPMPVGPNPAAPGMPAAPSGPPVPSFPTAPGASIPPATSSTGTTTTTSKPVEEVTKKLTGVSLKDPGFTPSPKTSTDTSTSAAPPAPAAPTPETKKA